jgi:hypothetical protein
VIFSGIHFDTLHADDETQVFDFLAVILALLWFEVQASLLKSVQDQVDMFLVFFKSMRVNKDVIDVHSAKLIKVGSENIVDKILKSCRAIGETTWHDQRLKKAISGLEGSLPYLPIRHSDEVIGPVNI